MLRCVPAHLPAPSTGLTHPNYLLLHLHLHPQLADLLHKPCCLFWPNARAMGGCLGIARNAWVNADPHPPPPPSRDQATPSDCPIEWRNIDDRLVSTTWMSHAWRRMPASEWRLSAGCRGRYCSSRPPRPADSPQHPPSPPSSLIRPPARSSGVIRGQGKRLTVSRTDDLMRTPAPATETRLCFSHAPGPLLGSTTVSEALDPVRFMRPTHLIVACGPCITIAYTSGARTSLRGAGGQELPSAGLHMHAGMFRPSCRTPQE